MLLKGPIIRSCSCRACMNASEGSCARVAMEALSAGGVGDAVVEFDEPSVERGKRVFHVLGLASAITRRTLRGFSATQ